MRIKGNNTVILHCHIFKNGGTTIDGILKKNFGELALTLERQDGPFFTSTTIIESAKRNHQAISISSHKISLPPPQDEDMLFIPLIMLREPLDRLGSMYSFYRRQAQDINHECRLAKRVSFRSFVSLLLQTGLNRSFTNLQSLFFLGNTTPQLIPVEATWPIIIENFKATRCVGILELFDESMLLWEEYLHNFFPSIDMSYTKKNISTNRASTLTERLQNIEEELGYELVVEFKKQNEFDYRLYQLAQKRIRAEIKERNNFHDKLNAFKEKVQCAKAKNTDPRLVPTEQKGVQEGWITISHKEKLLRVPPLPPEWYNVKTGTVDIVSCELFQEKSGLATVVVTHGQEVEVLITIKAYIIVKDPIVGITIENSSSEVVFCMNSFHSNAKMNPPPVGKNVAFSFGFKMPPLNSDSYTISPAFASGTQEKHTILCNVKNAVMFFVPMMIRPRPPGFLYLNDYSFNQG